MIILFRSHAGLELGLAWIRLSQLKGFLHTDNCGYPRHTIGQIEIRDEKYKKIRVEGIPVVQ